MENDGITNGAALPQDVVNLAVRVEPESLSRSARGSITGKVWCEYREDSFPEIGWYDFPVVILGWWLQALVTLIDRKERRAKMLFMDGPCEIVLSAEHSDVWSAQLIRRSSGAEVFREMEINPEVLMDSLLHASEQVLAQCAIANWLSPDVTLLKKERERVIRRRKGRK